jgi:hypothetical protein
MNSVFLPAKSSVTALALDNLVAIPITLNALHLHGNSSSPKVEAKLRVHRYQW